MPDVHCAALVPLLGCQGVRISTFQNGVGGEATELRASRRRTSPLRRPLGRGRRHRPPRFAEPQTRVLGRCPSSLVSSASVCLREGGAEKGWARSGYSANMALAAGKSPGIGVRLWLWPLGDAPILQQRILRPRGPTFQAHATQAPREVPSSPCGHGRPFAPLMSRHPFGALTSHLPKVI